ncbi:MAG: acetone carboxylase subunit gamma [Anaerolineales bacterium]|jgi:N-methylhydantoinase B|nr:acetone carboxylase subunit gamma [Anaerolineales bacterium]|tara:strand:+ start:24135 stop:24431 length:297 start_codon:yes stop_codon:yes gene_type:complete
MAMLNEFLIIATEESGDKVVRCARCEYDLCPATENHRLHALLHEGPVQEAGPHVNPHHLHGDKFVFRRFYCPNCVAQISTEVALKNEPILWDIELKVE